MKDKSVKSPIQHFKSKNKICY
ncbi:MAG: hypothetical protein JWQ57_732, partial [Mucilaginibacter sp.]|nr:hypothetical protein [Mucilaginibacter sp.]